MAQLSNDMMLILIEGSPKTSTLSAYSSSIPRTHRCTSPSCSCTAILIEGNTKTSSEDQTVLKCLRRSAAAQRGAHLRLAVDRGVEVHVVKNDRVRACQVQALAAGARAEKHRKDGPVGVIEPAPTQTTQMSEQRRCQSILLRGLKDITSEHVQSLLALWPPLHLLSSMATTRIRPCYLRVAHVREWGTGSGAGRTGRPGTGARRPRCPHP